MKSLSELLTRVTLILSVVALTACSNVNRNEQANLKMEEILKETGAVGLAVAVVKEGEIIFCNTYGYRDIVVKDAIAKDDLFRIASISKSFTTTALMTLLEQDKFSLESDVSDLIGFTVRNPKFPERVITLGMLLSHTSSLNDSQGYFSLDVLNPNTNPEFSLCYNDYEPGSEYQYCNLAFNTVGAIVEKYSGERFDKYLKQVLFKPMNLNADFNPDSLQRDKFVPIYTYIQADSATSTPGGFIERPEAYERRSRQIHTGYQLGYSTPLFSPTGGVKISVYDLARYMTMHMNLGSDPITGKTIISPASATLMQLPMVSTGEGEEYCLALRRSKNLIPGELMVGHTGSAYGLFSAMFFEPQKNFGFVMITNGYDPKYRDGFTLIQRDVIRALYDIFITK